MPIWELWLNPVMLFMKVNISQHIILIEWVDNHLNSINVEGIERKTTFDSVMALPVPKKVCATFFGNHK